MSKAVVPLVVALEDEYGNLYKVLETDKTLQKKIRKNLNKIILTKTEFLLEDTLTSSSRPWF